MTKPKKQTNQIIEITNEVVVNMIHEIRGEKVMLDFELAELYGYETKRFNEQVKNNIDRFPEEFMFRLTSKEVKSDMWSKKSATSKDSKHRRKDSLPYAFTEQGIYMLMTVLKGEIAVKQSIALVKAFKAMKDYISNNNLLPLNEVLKLSEQTNQNTNAIAKLEENVENQGKQLQIMMENFVDPNKIKHFVIRSGHRFEADIAYQSIYKTANKSVILIDDYISGKTLDLLRICNKDINITIFSDNVARDKITQNILDDFAKETLLQIHIYPSHKMFHDRYIIIDYKTSEEAMFHSGSSNKDSGSGLTEIKQVEKQEVYHEIIDELFAKRDEKMELKNDKK